MVNTAVVIVIMMGVLYSTQLQISKAMERQYIDTFKIIKDRMVKRKELKAQGKNEKLEPISPEKKKIFYLYIFALILNNTVMFYVWIAGTQDSVPSTYFTSVIGIGLIALLIYSYFVMKEPISKYEIIGAFTVIVGTVFIGYDSVIRDPIDQGDIKVGAAMIAIVAFLLIGAVFAYFAFKKGTPAIIGLVFGMFSGGCGSMEAVLKGIGLAQGSEKTGFFPQTGPGWFAFVFSFLMATFAFTFTQWGFAKGARANALVPTFNSMYVLLPQILYPWLLPNYQWFWSTYAGIILIIVGIVFMQAFKEEEKLIHEPDYVGEEIEEFVEGEEDQKETPSEKIESQVIKESSSETQTSQS